MMKTTTDPAPLGIIDSLSAGFSVVAQKPVLLLIPLLLDMFLWLGPRLSIAPIASELAADLQAVAENTTDNSTLLFEQNTTEILGSYNLFAALSTWPIGAPSLLAGNNVESNPIGSRVTIELTAIKEVLAWLLGLVVMGLLAGSLYLGLIARWTSEDPSKLRSWVGAVWVYWIRIIAFVSAVLIGAFLLSVPFFLAVEIVALITAPLASLMLLIGIGLGMWLLFHLFFAPHGILMYGIGVRQAINSSIILVRRYRLSAAGLLLISVVISLGLTTIWDIPTSRSWLRLIAIAGNAFVNTGLVTATFFFYQERIGVLRANTGISIEG
jgi:hypothetical protein